MKVTALIPDELVSQLRQYSSGKNLTEALIIAIDEWVSLRKIKKLNRDVANAPLRFKAGFSANGLRKVNRRR